MHTAPSIIHIILGTPTPLSPAAILAAVLVAGGATVLVAARWRPSAGENCRRCGWPRGSNACRHAHLLSPRTRMWSRREWERYRSTDKLPWWDVIGRSERRRSR